MEQKIKPRGLNKGNNTPFYLQNAPRYWLALVGISNMPGLCLVVAEWLPELLAHHVLTFKTREEAGYAV